MNAPLGRDLVALRPLTSLRGCAARCAEVSPTFRKTATKTSRATPRGSIRCDQYRPSAVHSPWDIARWTSSNRWPLNQCRAHWIQINELLLVTLVRFET